MTNHPGPAWQRIARDLIEQVSTGRIPVGEKIPSYRDLQTVHGTGLSTVRAAVKHLRGVGLLQGEQGAGVFVLRMPRDSDAVFDDGDAGSLVDRRLTDLETRVAHLQAQLEQVTTQLALTAGDTDGLPAAPSEHT